MLVFYRPAVLASHAVDTADPHLTQADLEEYVLGIASTPEALEAHVLTCDACLVRLESSIKQMAARSQANLLTSLN